MVYMCMGEGQMVREGGTRLVRANARSHHGTHTHTCRYMLAWLS